MKAVHGLNNENGIVVITEIYGDDHEMRRMVGGDLIHEILQYTIVNQERQCVQMDIISQVYENGIHWFFICGDIITMPNKKHLCLHTEVQI